MHPKAAGAPIPKELEDEIYNIFINAIENGK